MLNTRLLLSGVLIAFSIAAPLPSELCGSGANKVGPCPGLEASLGNESATIEINKSGGGTPQQRVAYRADRANDAPPARPFREPFTAYGITDAGPVTLSDIASFRPVTGGAGMEPDGWTVTGLDTNFYSAAGPHVVDGELLGFAASVRFTPRAWHWAYGDGATRTTTTPGASWAALGVAEFDPTATSHVYAASGTFTIDLSVEFGAEYRVGDEAWTAIEGALSVPAARFTATAGSARTVLVARDCLVNPRGPGC